MPQLKIQYRDPVQLTVHPALKQIPALGEEELKPIRAGLKYGGESIAPILVTDEGQILSDTGRTAWLCAKARQLKEVPVCICAAADVHLIIIRDLAHRRHLSKSAIAYLAVPHLQPALDAARMAKLEKLRKSPENAVVASGDSEAQTVEELGEELGVSRDLLFRAQAVRKAFAKYPGKYSFNIVGGEKDGALEESTLKGFYEPKLLRAFVGGEHENRRPIGLGGILAGIESVIATDKDKFRPGQDHGQMELKLWEQSFKPLKEVGPTWKNLNEEDQSSVLVHWKNTVKKLPDDLRTKMAAILEESIKA